MRISRHSSDGPTCFITGKCGFGFGYNYLLENKNLQFWLEDYTRLEKNQPQLVKLIEVQRKQLILPHTEYLLEHYKHRINLLNL